MKPHNLTYATDLTGLEVVGVSLSNRPETAWLFKADYDVIVKQYGTPAWCLTGNGKGRFYVRFKPHGDQNRTINVARLVAGDYRHTAVRYRDKDQLNLRLTNLRHDHGRGGRSEQHRGRHALRIPTEGNARV